MMKILSITLIALFVAFGGGPPAVTYHNLPEDPVAAYAGSNSIFFAKITSVKTNQEGMQTIGIKLIKQIKGEINENQILIQNSNLLLTDSLMGQNKINKVN